MSLKWGEPSTVIVFANRGYHVQRNFVRSSEARWFAEWRGRYLGHYPTIGAAKDACERHAQERDKAP